jgi:hypothetical protein
VILEHQITEQNLWILIVLWKARSGHPCHLSLNTVLIGNDMLLVQLTVRFCCKGYSKGANFYTHAEPRLVSVFQEMLFV